MRTKVNSEEWAVEKGPNGNQKRSVHRTGGSTVAKICGSQKKGKSPDGGIPCALTEEYQRVSVSLRDRSINGSACPWFLRNASAEGSC